VRQDARQAGDPGEGPDRTPTQWDRRMFVQSTGLCWENDPRMGATVRAGDDLERPADVLDSPAHHGEPEMTGLHRPPARRIVDAYAVVVDLKDDPVVLVLDHGPDSRRVSVLDGIDDQLLDDRDEPSSQPRVGCAAP
jgi:hypothetical protein